MKVIEKDIPGFGTMYRVTNTGEVISYAQSDEGKKMKHGKIRGYEVVKLMTSKNTSKLYRVHQLVAMAFLNHTPNGMESIVTHIDGDRTNNHVNNLQIVKNYKANDRQKLRKVMFGLNFETQGFFHEWTHLNGNVVAIIEKEDGSIVLEYHFNIKFI